jgi:hypothetical protein
MENFVVLFLGLKKKVEFQDHNQKTPASMQAVLKNFFLEIAEKNSL